MSGREKLFIFCFLVVCITVAAWVERTKGIAQLGNVVSFFGGLATLIPAFSQVLTNRRYTIVIEMPGGREFRILDKGLEEARRRAFMSFKSFDYILFVGGLILICAGFLISIVVSPDVTT